MHWKTIQKWIRIIGITLAVYLGLEYLLPMVFPFCIGFVLAAGMYPLQRFLQRRFHLHRSLAGFLAFFFGIGAVAGILTGLCLFACLIGRSLCGGNVLGFCQRQGNELWRLGCEFLHELTGEWILKPGGFSAFFARLKDSFLSLENGQALAGWKMIGGQTIRLIANLIVACVSALMILNDYERIRRRLSRTGFTGALKSGFFSYLKAQFIIWACVTAICIGGLWLLGKKQAVLIGVLIGICDALPFLGTGICLWPWAVYSLMQSQTWSAIGLLLINVTASFTRQMLEPKLIGAHFGVHPLIILMSIYIGIQVYSHAGFLLGPLSAFIIWPLIRTKEEKDVEE